jgi:cytochrome b involved in lipid metabolism
MSNKVLGLSLLAVSLVIIAGFGFWQLTQSEDPIEETRETIAQTETESAAPETTEQQTYTLAKVAEHSSESDCWTIIDGNVYDITSYVPRHPGGDEILRACGADGTSLFEQRQTANGEVVGSGTPHSASAQSQLQSLQIGTVE